MTVEICIDSFEQAAAAENYGAKRVELCSALDVGGLTPSPGMVEKCAGLKEIEIHAMIRPRAGGFSYDSDELEIMELDIKSFAGSGIEGVVFGILTEDSDIDIGKNERLLNLAKSNGLEATFHRAFDLTRDPIMALDQIIEMGFDRILTSGKGKKAIDGIDMIKKLVKHSNHRVQIMAGSGIGPDNVQELQKSGIDAIHFTARMSKNQIAGLDMGQNFQVDEDKIRTLLKLIE